MTENFDDIRSYRDDETATIGKQLFNNPSVLGILQKLLPELANTDVNALFSGINNRRDFQEKLMRPILERNIIPTFEDLTFSGMEHLDPSKSYLFISNHRDIVLDSAVMNYFLHVNGFSTAEIAIGDNLLKEKWIEDLVRLNKSFIVKRSGDRVELLNASKKLSAYIRDTILNRNESVWIAQRAGRAKDGNDETNPGLLKMFAMSAGEDPINYFRELRIVPVSMSYEYDPCDARKARELYTELTEGDYVKSATEDVESMKLGIVLPKGRGHIHFGKVLDAEISTLSPKKSEFFGELADLIDREIHTNYKLWKTNLIANELLQPSESDRSIEDLDKRAFVARMDTSLSEMAVNNEKAREIFLQMYQQPLINRNKY